MLKFVTILLIQALCGMELDLFIPSFPELQRVFDLSTVMVQLTISVNFIALCICCLFAGALGDRYNRKHILLLGLTLFVLGSFICVMAPNFTWLLIGRVLQGIGISAPAVLSFSVLLEDYAIAQQAAVMGMINGIKTLAVAIAPLIGSLVNLYFSWRGNFTILLGVGLVCLAISFKSIPDKAGNTAISLSLKEYLPLLKSQKFMIFVLGLTLMTSSYLLFMGMAPILYMEGMGISLKHFGYYQGALTLAFSLVCIASPTMLKRFGARICFYSGSIVCLLCLVLLLALVVWQVHQPLLITAVLMIFSVGLVFPINILYPACLELLPDTKGRAAGVAQCSFLLLTSILLELTGYYYQGKFMPIGLIMSLALAASLLLIQKIIKKNWLSLS